MNEFVEPAKADMTKADIVDLSRRAHGLTESLYHQHRASKGGAGWNEKQRLLLADMALHLVQTALRDGEIDTATLRNNLYSILTISAPFLPERNLTEMADAIIHE